jgi:hypothetical protein
MLILGDNLFLGVRFAFTLCNQVLKAVINIAAPGLITNLIAFIGRNQSAVDELYLGFAFLLRNLKLDCCNDPLGLVLHKIEIIIQAKPNNLFAGYNLC